MRRSTGCYSQRQGSHTSTHSLQTIPEKNAVSAVSSQSKPLPSERHLIMEPTSNAIDDEILVLDEYPSAHTNFQDIRFSRVPYGSSAVVKDDLIPRVHCPGNNGLRHSAEIATESSEDAASSIPNRESPKNCVNRTLETHHGLEDGKIVLNEVNTGRPKKIQFACRSIRIGSFETYPAIGKGEITVILNNRGFFFMSTVVSNVFLMLKHHEILNISYCFIHDCMQFIFIHMSPTMFENVKSTFIQKKLEPPYFDPEAQKVVTFLLNNLTGEDLKKLLQYFKIYFPKLDAIKEIKSWEEANEILIASFPHQRGQSKNGHDDSKIVSHNHITSLNNELEITDSGIGCPLLQLTCKKIIIGKFIILPNDHSSPHLIVRITSKTFSVAVSEKKNNFIILKYGDFMQLIFHFGEQLSVIFFRTTTECAKRTLFQLSAMNNRRMCHATETELEMHHRIMFFTTNLDESQMSSLRNMFCNCHIPSKEIVDATEAKRVLQNFSDKPPKKTSQRKQASPAQQKPLKSVGEDDVIVIDSDEENAASIPDFNINEDEIITKPNSLMKNISPADVSKNSKIMKATSHSENERNDIVERKCLKLNVTCSNNISKLNVGQNKETNSIALANNIQKLVEPKDNFAENVDCSKISVKKGKTSHENKTINVDHVKNNVEDHKLLTNVGMCSMRNTAETVSNRPFVSRYRKKHSGHNIKNAVNAIKSINDNTCSEEVGIKSIRIDRIPNSHLEVSHGGENAFLEELCAVEDVRYNIADLVKTRRRSCRGNYEKIAHSDVQEQNPPSNERSIDEESATKFLSVCPKNNWLTSNIVARASEKTESIIHLEKSKGNFEGDPACSNAKNSGKKRQNASSKKTYSSFKRQKPTSVDPSLDVIKRGKNFNYEPSLNINSVIESQSVSNMQRVKENNAEPKRYILLQKVGHTVPSSKCKKLTVKNCNLQNTTKNKKTSKDLVCVTNSSEGSRNLPLKLRLKRRENGFESCIAPNQNELVKSKTNLRKTCEDVSTERCNNMLGQPVVLLQRCDAKSLSQKESKIINIPVPKISKGRKAKVPNAATQASTVCQIGNISRKKCLDK